MLMSGAVRCGALLRQGPGCFDRPRLPLMCFAVLCFASTAPGFTFDTPRGACVLCFVLLRHPPGVLCFAWPGLTWPYLCFDSPWLCFDTPRLCALPGFASTAPGFALPGLAWPHFDSPPGCPALLLTCFALLCFDTPRPYLRQPPGFASTAPGGALLCPGVLCLLCLRALLALLCFALLCLRVFYTY